MMRHILVLSLTLWLPALGAESLRPFVWNVGNRFVEIDRSGRIVGEIKLPNGVHAEDVVRLEASADRSELYFLWRKPEGIGLWASGKLGVKPLHVEGGDHFELTLDEEQQVVYFSAYPHRHEQMTWAGPESYAQVYRIRLDGSGLVQLTNEVGCHMKSAPFGKGFIVLHSIGREGRRTLELVGESRSVKSLRTDNPQAFDVDPNRNRLAVAEGRGRTTQLWLYELPSMRVVGSELFDGEVSDIALGTELGALIVNTGGDGPRIMRLKVARQRSQSGIASSGVNQ
jgi:hypothetical protein